MQHREQLILRTFHRQSYSTNLHERLGRLFDIFARYDYDPYLVRNYFRGVYLNENHLNIIRDYVRMMRSQRLSTSVYSDKQNVHNTTIQKSVILSITSLLKDPKPDTPDFSALDEHVQGLIQSYCDDTTSHSVLLITYKELIAYVWARIQLSEYKDTLSQILEQEIRDSEGLCYIGRFNRTINALCGFYDDIEVQISDPDRINAIIHQHKTKDKITAAMQEAGYDTETIEVWTSDL